MLRQATKISRRAFSTSAMAQSVAKQVVMRGTHHLNLEAVGHRVESDTMGKVNVSNDVYWGAQTQRSLENFKIGGPQARMPIEIIRGWYGGAGELCYHNIAVVRYGMRTRSI